MQTGFNQPVGKNARQRSVREQVSPEEWEVRVELAACYRLTELFGMTDLIANHISCRVPGTHDQFLINPFGLLYDEVNASNLVKIDVHGNTILNGSGCDVNTAGFVIHSAVHMARPEVACVAHTHTLAGMAVSAMKSGLTPYAQTGMPFLHLAYHDFEGIADELDERERLVADLGQHDAMILRNHGLLVTGASIGIAFSLLYRLERACQVQLAALSCNTELSVPPRAVMEKTYQKYRTRANDPGVNGELAWGALLRRLDRIDPGYKN
ncbi:MAG: class II aldolase/adducin family protein [Burkholderiaceae bacterium]|nr:class II aldolase/adducin family protein [Burkholderiaceae bacterium]